MNSATAASTVADAQFLVANDPALILTMTVGQTRTCLTYLQEAMIILVAFGLFHPSRIVALGTFLLDYTTREVELEAVQPQDTSCTWFVRRSLCAGLIFGG